MSVNPIFLIGAAGAAAYLVTSKKKSSGKSSTSSNGKTNGNGESSTVLSGDIQGYGWRVRKAKSIKGFADMYYGEWKAPSKYALWVKAHDDARSDPKEAELLAKEKIAGVLSEIAADIPLQGNIQGIPWRVVRELVLEPGSPPGQETEYFFGEYKLPGGPVEVWSRLEPRPTPDQAKALAGEAIAMFLAAQAGGDVQG
jgi:hypothetical protein